MSKKTNQCPNQRTNQGAIKKQVAKVMRFQSTNEKEMQVAINLFK